MHFVAKLGVTSSISPLPSAPQKKNPQFLPFHIGGGMDSGVPLRQICSTPTTCSARLLEKELVFFVSGAKSAPCPPNAGALVLFSDLVSSPSSNMSEVKHIVLLYYLPPT
jgi:hypothetical protein